MAPLRIALDSNVFRNKEFLTYLIVNKAKFDIGLPIIVQLEVGYFYLLKGSSWERYEMDMQKMDCVMMKWDLDQPKIIVQKAFTTKHQLPFKDHIRDYLIGTQTEKDHRMLITNNIDHFRWILKSNLMTPEDFLKSQENINPKNR